MGLCECGCGGEAGASRRFISGHNSRVRFKPRVERACQFCGKTFSGTAAAMRGRVYCSSACRDEERRQCTGALSQSYTPRITVACATCGAPVSVTPGRLGARFDQYCSPECGRDGQRRKLKGRQKEASHWRTLAKRVYGSRCVVCGFDPIVEVHHLQPRSQGGSDEIENLVPVCPNHHAMAHLGLLSVEELVKARAMLIPGMEPQ